MVKVVRAAAAVAGMQLAGLLQQRNLLAASLGRGASLLPVLREPRACAGCFQLSNCALLHRVRQLLAAHVVLFMLM